METTETRTGASSLSENVSGQTQKVAEAAREKGKGVAEEQKTMAARTLGRMAQALHQTAANLEQGQDSATARYFHMAADGLNRFSANLERRDLESLLAQSQEYARRYPAVAFGGAMAAGFMLSRFMKSSSGKRRSAGSSSGVAETAGAAFTGQPEEKRVHMGIEPSEMRQSRPYGNVPPGQEH